jgi:hypothetical protein
MARLGRLRRLGDRTHQRGGGFGGHLARPADADEVAAVEAQLGTGRGHQLAGAFARRGRGLRQLVWPVERLGRDALLPLPELPALGTGVERGGVAAVEIGLCADALKRRLPK